MSKTPKVGTSIIIMNESNEILIGKRKGSHGEGFYSVPGGHVEHNEKVLDACYRELEEETGITRELIDSIKFVDFSEDFFPEEDKHYITMYYAVYVPDSLRLTVRNLEPDKCKEWLWVHLNALPKNMFCDTYNMIQKYFDMSV